MDINMDKNLDVFQGELYKACSFLQQSSQIETAYFMVIGDNKKSLNSF